MSKIDLDNYIDFMVEYKKEISKEYEEEIERLNKENTILTQNSQYLVKQKDELEEVINKAIEYIETRQKNKYNIRLFEAENDLLDILKGSDKEW